MPEGGVSLGLRIFFLGFILIFIGILATMIGVVMRGPSTSASYGGIILIGPIPIIIGAGPESPLILALLLITLIFLIITLFILRPRFHLGA